MGKKGFTVPETQLCPGPSYFLTQALPLHHCKASIDSISQVKKHVQGLAFGIVSERDLKPAFLSQRPQLKSPATCTKTLPLLECEEGWKADTVLGTEEALKC